MCIQILRSAEKELFCLHPELEMFVFGGEQGPIKDTDFHIVLKLINAPDDLLIDLTCVFMSYCSYKNLFVDETKFQEKDFGDKVSSAIIYSADGLSKGINWAGEKTKGLLSAGAETYTQKYPQTETPTQISSGVQKGMQYASTGSKYVAKGTGYVASAIGTAATYVGKHIATKIDEKYGNSSDPNSASRKTWRQAGKIASGVLAGYGKVWSALETSGKSVAVASRDASTVVVKHRHGDQAGNVTYNAMNVGVNMTKTFFHVEDMGMKKICKKYRQVHWERVPADSFGQTQFGEQGRPTHSATTHFTMIRKIVQNVPQNNMLASVQ